MSTVHTRTLQSQPLETVARFIRGITFSPEDKVAPGTEGSAVCMRTANVQDVLDESDLIAVPLEFVKRDEQFLVESDILVSTANSWNLVGKCSWVPKQGDCATLGNLRYFGKKSACLDLRLLNRHEDAAYGENR